MLPLDALVIALVVALVVALVDALLELGPVEAWAALSSLTRLDLSSNQLHGTPLERAHRLPQLEHLLLPFNKITSLQGINNFAPRLEVSGRAGERMGEREGE